MGMRGLVRVAGALLLLPALLSGCGDDEPALADELSRYTDRGDGCQQVVSAIAYTDLALKPLGQERYQEFNDEVRSKIGTVGGTISLEVRDFPSRMILEQARRVAELAQETAALDARGARRVASLREYRREATQLVIDCSREVRGL
jgi:hypothetical protein